MTTYPHLPICIYVTCGNASGGYDGAGDGDEMADGYEDYYAYGGGEGYEEDYAEDADGRGGGDE